MRKQTTILYILAWITFVISTFVLFPSLNSNALIPVFALLALGTWIYGRTAGLLLAQVAFIHHFAVFQFYATEYGTYTDRVTGTFLCIAVVVFCGTLSKSLEGIKEANLRLDVAVAERTAELTGLTHRLISNAEAARVSRGQELHDGIGQQLTGIQLYATSLAEQLLEEGNPSASLAHSLCNRSRSTHQLIRKTARSLFPVQINEIGLMPALEEMTACLAALKPVQTNIHAEGELLSLPSTTALQFYRICQETALYIITHSNAGKLAIRVTVSPREAQLSIRHDGGSLAERLEPSNEAKLIDYRLNLINGTQEHQPLGQTAETFLFHAPLAEVPV